MSVWVALGFSAVNGGQFWHCIIRTLGCTACTVAGSNLARCGAPKYLPVFSPVFLPVLMSLVLLARRLKPLLKIQAFALVLSYWEGLNAGRPNPSLLHKKTANLSALPSRGVGPQFMRSWETVFPDHSPQSGAAYGKQPWRVGVTFVTNKLALP